MSNKSKVRRLRQRVEDMSVAFNDLMDRQAALEAIVTNGMGRIEGHLMQMQKDHWGVKDQAVTVRETTDHLAQIADEREEPLVLVKCPLCKQNFFPVNRDGQDVFPPHSTAPGLPIPDAQCTGSNMAVEPEEIREWHEPDVPLDKVTGMQVVISLDLPENYETASIPAWRNSIDHLADEFHAMLGQRFNPGAVFMTTSYNTNNAGTNNRLQ